MIENMLDEMFKSVIDNDRSSVVLCDLEHTMVYLNPAAVRNYEKWGGAELLGKSLLECHNENSQQIIKKVVAWFAEDRSNNMIYTYKNEKQNKDVYMVALRNSDRELIGYYEKHEYRDAETAGVCDFVRSLV